jgi:hypothetical protein
MTLKKFIEQENMMIAMFPIGGETKYPEDTSKLTGPQKTTLANRLSSSLSPECLTCDGELRGAKLRARANLLHKAKAELEALGVVIPAY